MQVHHHETIISQNNIVSLILHVGSSPGCMVSFNFYAKPVALQSFLTTISHTLLGLPIALLLCYTLSFPHPVSTFIHSLQEFKSLLSATIGPLLATPLPSISVLSCFKCYNTQPHHLHVKSTKVFCCGHHMFSCHATYCS